MKVDRLVTYGPAGAGLGRTGLLPDWVGRKVPEMSVLELDRDEFAESSNVRVRLDTRLVPPTLAMSTALAPEGPTRSRFTSWGAVWEKPVRVTVSLVTVPLRPETLMGEG